MNVLFVGAHPDDIETFAGGTAARYAERGDRLYFCVATNGNCGSSTLAPEEIAGVRHQEAEKGAGLVGAELIWLDIDDEFLLDSRQTRMQFIEALRRARPEVVICHWIDDYNADHTVSGKLVDDCVPMARIPNIRTESPPTDVIPHVYYMDTPAGVNFAPELYVDITAVFARKVEMVQHHASQASWMKDLYGYELEAFLEIPARFRGLQAGCAMAEAFRPSVRWGRTFTSHYLPGFLSEGE